MGERIPMGQSLRHGTGLGGRVVQELYGRKGSKQRISNISRLSLKKKIGCGRVFIVG